jgi:uncharacterized protein (DUF427 family)
VIRATWNGAVIAESDRTTVVEGNHYFPLEDVHRRFLIESAKHTLCMWKGTASYFSLEVGGVFNTDAAWTYPNPTTEAQEIKGLIAFWRGVEVHEVDDPIRSEPAQP